MVQLFSAVKSIRMNSYCLSPSGCNYKTQIDMLPAIGRRYGRYPLDPCPEMKPGYDKYSDLAMTNDLGNIGFCNGIQRRAVIRNHDVPVEQKFRYFRDNDPNKLAIAARHIKMPKPKPKNSGNIALVSLVAASMLTIMLLYLNR